MTDTPIYDALITDPIRNNRSRARVANHEGFTRPVSAEVADVLMEWGARHHFELAQMLAPLGMHPHDIASPGYSQVIYEDDLLPLRVVIGFDGSMPIGRW